MMSRFLRPWLILAALAVVPLLANWPVVSGWLTTDPVYTVSGLGTGLVAGPLPGSTSIDPSGGLMTEALGRAAALEWLGLRIPWWNPFDGVGLPLAAEGQNQALFLPFVLLFALHNGLLLIALAVQEVAAFSTYALLRRMTLSRAAAFSGAALFAVNGTFAWFSHSPIFPAAFAPMLLLGIEMEWRAAAQQRGPSRGWVVAAIALAFSLYAGFPETAYLDGLLGGAWTVLRMLQCNGRSRVRFALRMGTAAATGLLLAAPFVLPSLHLLSVGQVSLPRLLDFSTVAAPPAAFPVLVMPYLVGPQTMVTDVTRVEYSMWSYVGGYLTVPVVFLAILAVAAPRTPDRALRWLLAAWCVATIAASFGVPGITWAVYSMPAVAQTMVFRYAPPSWELSASVLASMAIDDWQRSGARWRRVAVALALVSAVATGAVGLAAHDSIPYLRANVPHYDPWFFFSLGEAAVITLLAAGLLASRPAPWRARLLAALLIGEGIALFSVPRLAGLRHASLDTAAITFLRQHLGLQRLYAFGTLLPNYPAYFQLASINSNYVPAPRNWTEYIRNALDPHAQTEFFAGNTVFGDAPGADMAAFRDHLPAYRELGVRYVLVPPWATLAPATRTGTPVAVPGVSPSPVFADNAVRIHEVGEPAAYFETTGGNCGLVPVSREALTADCTVPARLIRRELFFDGWRAAVNGTRVAMQPADPLFQAIDLPAGHSRVEFRYAPPHALASLVLFLCGLLIVSIGMIPGALVAIRGRMR